MSQNNNFSYHVRKKKAIWPGIIQQPINALAGSSRIGVKTAWSRLQFTLKELECSRPTLASVSPGIDTHQTTALMYRLLKET